MAVTPHAGNSLFCVSLLLSSYLCLALCLFFFIFDQFYAAFYLLEVVQLISPVSKMTVVFVKATE